MRNASIIVLSATAMLILGCTSSGLSAREGPGRDVTAYLYASELSVAGDPDAADQAPPQIIKPASIAVVQVGEVTPPTEMLDELRKNRNLFRDVSGVTGLLPPSWQGHHRHDGEPQQEQVQEHVQQLRSIARNMGADYLLIYGGTIDATERGTPLSLLDITIVGMFVVPSRVLSAEGRATAVLIDVPTGRVVATATADGDSSALSTSFGSEGAQTSQMRALRDEVIEELTKEIVDRFEGL